MRDPTRGVWGMLPEEILKNGSTTLGRVSLHSEQKCDVTLNWNLPSCVESPCYRSVVRRVQTQQGLNYVIKDSLLYNTNLL